MIRSENFIFLTPSLGTDAVCSLSTHNLGQVRTRYLMLALILNNLNGDGGNGLWGRMDKNSMN